MFNQKDSLLTFNINLSIKDNFKDCFMIYRPINKSISIVNLTLNIFSSNQKPAKLFIHKISLNSLTKIASYKILLLGKLFSYSSIRIQKHQL